MKAKEMMKKVLLIAAVMGLAALPALAETLCSGESAEVKLDLATGTTRRTVATETLTYSAEWDGGDAVSLAANGTTLASGLAGNGTYDWTPDRTGLFTITHTVVTNGFPVVLTAEFIVPVQVGDDAWALMTNGVCTISGTGATWDTQPLAIEHMNITNVVIQDGITSVGRAMFHKCYNLTNVTVAASVTNLADYAFFRCLSLERIDFGRTLASIRFGTSSLVVHAGIRMEGEGPVVFPIPEVTTSKATGLDLYGKTNLTTDVTWHLIPTGSSDPAALKPYKFFKYDTAAEPL